jgi:uncharacterized protein (TIGR01777 family)
MEKIVLAGGTGFIGAYLQKKFVALGYQVIIISRDARYVLWSDTTAIVAALDNAKMLINLAGKSVNCRYTKENKALILASRLDTTRALGEAMQQCAKPPKLWLNASSSTIYRHAQDRYMTEADTEMDDGFSEQVVKQWEALFFSFADNATRQIALRISIVLGKDSAVINLLKKMVGFGLGGRQGSGKQMFSWIHVEDFYQSILLMMEKESLNGVINMASPRAINNAHFMQAFRKEMNVKIGLPAEAWMLKIGSVIIGTEPELVLKSRL